MRKITVATMLAAASLGLAACSERAQDEAAEAANAVATDVETTTEEALEDIEAAADDALNGAEATIDSAGNTADRVGNEVEREVEK